MIKILLTFLIVISSLLLIAQTNSSADGEWATVVQTSYDIIGGNAVNISHVVSADNEIRILFGGTLNVLTDSLIINSGLVTFIGANLTINSGATLYINGDLSNSLWGNIVINGTLKVTGDVDNIGSDIILGDGAYLGVGGNLTNTGGVIDNVAGGSIKVGGSIFPDILTIDGDPDNVQEGIGSEAALPIELLYFNINTTSIYNILNWATASETNNDYFIIEKSYNFLEWYEIANITGAGNSQSTLYYWYEDTADNFLTYYRLTQVDYNGQSETFDVISVFNTQIDTEGYHRIIVYDTRGLIVTELSSITELNSLERNKLYILKFINKYTSTSMKYILK